MEYCSEYVEKLERITAELASALETTAQLSTDKQARHYERVAAKERSIVLVHKYFKFKNSSD